MKKHFKQRFENPNTGYGKNHVERGRTRKTTQSRCTAKGSNKKSQDASLVKSHPAKLKSKLWVWQENLLSEERPQNVERSKQTKQTRVDTLRNFSEQKSQDALLNNQFQELKNPNSGYGEILSPRGCGAKTPKRTMCLISWERTQKRDSHKLFRPGEGGYVRVKKGVPNGPFSATKSLV